MVGVSREYSWYAKGWELLSGRFSTLKGKLAIQKEFKNCTHIYIYFHFWWVKQKDAFWWEDLKSTTVFSPGSAPRWHLVTSQEFYTEEIKAQGGVVVGCWGGEGVCKRPTEGWDLMKESKMKKDNILPFIESGAVQTWWCSSRMESNTTYAFDLANFELVFGSSDGSFNLNR